MPEGYFSNRVEQELQLAESSRRAGNEGRARVCARRAAGFALQETLNVRRAEPVTKNVFQLLLQADQLLDLPAEAQRPLQWLTARVDTRSQLPQGVDLIAEANQFISILADLDSLRRRPIRNRSGTDHEI